MSTESIELELRKQAEILGDLNLELNKYIEQNQLISKQIVQLENRITKKRKLIEQENKDKKIIHQKLINAENKKQELEILANSTPGKQMELTPHGEQYAEQEIVRPASLKQFKEFKEEKVQKKIVSIKSEESVKKVQQEHNQYDNTDKGDYVPPALNFNDKSDKSDSSSDNQNADEMLENVRKKLEGTGVQDDDDDQ